MELNFPWLISTRKFTHDEASQADEIFEAEEATNFVFATLFPSSQSDNSRSKHTTAAEIVINHFMFIVWPEKKIPFFLCSLSPTFWVGESKNKTKEQQNRLLRAHCSSLISSFVSIPTDAVNLLSLLNNTERTNVEEMSAHINQVVVDKNDFTIMFTIRSKVPSFW